jgi:hypothetical protein
VVVFGRDNDHAVGSNHGVAPPWKLILEAHPVVILWQRKLRNIEHLGFDIRAR